SLPRPTQLDSPWSGFGSIASVSPGCLGCCWVGKSSAWCFVRGSCSVMVGVSSVLGDASCVGASRTYPRASARQWADVQPSRRGEQRDTDGDDDEPRPADRG